jgi:hypothetical protein
MYPVCFLLYVEKGQKLNLESSDGEGVGSDGYR